MNGAQVSAFQANSGIAPSAMATVLVGVVFAVLLVWGALVALVVVGLRADSVAGLVTAAVVVDGALLVVLTVVSLRIARQPEPVETGPPPAQP